jgi:uncharacterized protein (TIGR02594 family)
MDISPYTLAQRYMGIREMSAAGKDHPLIQWWLSLCGYDLDVQDEVPWCSAFVNGIAWELNLPRSKSAAARSWLNVGMPVDSRYAQQGDIVILPRGANPAQGHVGFFSTIIDGNVHLLGGNQGNSVSIAGFPFTRILGVRRLI